MDVQATGVITVGRPAAEYFDWVVQVVRSRVGWLSSYMIPAGFRVLAQPNTVVTIHVWWSVHHVHYHAEDIVVENDDVGRG